MSCAPQRCEMSYMNPRYVPVRLPGEGAGGAVLYRYFDDLVFDTEERSCSLVLLFVPGHGGSHTQVRSIGSEVLKMAFWKSRPRRSATLSWPSVRPTGISSWRCPGSTSLLTRWAASQRSRPFAIRIRHRL
jgi:hypothetical protein